MSMHRPTVLTLVFIILFSPSMFAQQAELDEPSVAYWVHYWSQPPVILFGPEEEDFYKNMQVVLFPYDNHDDPTNPNVLETNIQWLKDHPNVHFYINGYASSRGPLIYNLALSPVAGGLGKGFHDQPGHRGESNQASGGMGRTLSGVSGTDR